MGQRRPSRSGGGGSRTQAVSHITSPTRPSNQTNSRSAGHPSTSTAGAKVDDEVDSIRIADLTLDTPLRPFIKPRRVPATPFHFLTLPSELRLKIYEYFFDGDGYEAVLDLAPYNYKRYHRKLGLMRVNRQIHDEATHYFYSTRSFRIFPTYPGRYFKTKRPLLARLKKCQRECIQSLELRLGPGWNAPPKGWVVTDALGLAECRDVHTLSIFVECDPSDSVFKGFRRAEGFYEGFSQKLLTSVMDAMPSLKALEFDAWSSVKKRGAMMTGLLDVASRSGHQVLWGPERGWDDSMDDNDKPVTETNIVYVDGIPISLPGYQHNILISA